MVKNGQKQPKTGFLTVFWSGKIVHPRCKSYFPWMDFSENFSVCSKLPELEFHRFRFFQIPLEACFFYRFSKKMLFLRVFYKNFFFFFLQKMIFGSRGRYGFRFGSLRCVLMPYGPIENRTLFYPSLLLGDSNVQTCPQ